MMSYYRPMCHVSPKVFMEPDKLINKGIIKKLIPFYTNTDIIFPPSRNVFVSNPDDRRVKVVVDKFDEFFVRPVKPEPSTCTNGSLNDCLIENIEEILSLV